MTAIRWQLAASLALIRRYGKVRSTMEMSPDINELSTALAKAQGQMAPAEKDRENPFFHSRYATLAAVWDAIRAPLASNGLAVVQAVAAQGADVTVTTMLTHTSGQWMRESLLMVAKDHSPQAVGSACSYGRRYALSALVGVAVEDDDGEGATDHKAPAVKPAPFRAGEKRETASGPNAGRPSVSPIPAAPAGPATGPSGEVYVRHAQQRDTRKAGVTRYEFTLSTGEVVATIKDATAKIMKQALADEVPVTVTTKQTQYGLDVDTVTVRKPTLQDVAADSKQRGVWVDEVPPPDDSSIPF